MSNTETEYAEKVKAHLTENFPEGPPPVVNMLSNDWAETIKAKCESPKETADADAVILAAVDEWFVNGGYKPEGTIYRHAEKHDAQVKAQAEAEARKRAAETAPLKAVIKDCVLECLVETGLVEMRPQAKKQKPVIKGHRH